MRHDIIVIEEFSKLGYKYFDELLFLNKLKEFFLLWLDPVIDIHVQYM